MKKTISFAVIFMFLMIACNKGGTANVPNLPKPKDFTDKVSYMIGNDVGTGMSRDSIKINFDYFLMGMQTAMAGDSSLLSKSEIDSLRAKFQESMMKNQEARRKLEDAQWKEAGIKNKIESEKFLAENKKKPGVITTASGLQYQIIKEGNGPIPKETDRIKFHIKGSYMDGKEFDNSYSRQPIILDVSSQIPGWREAWTMMKVGSIWRVWVPSSLGWGENGMRPTIPAAAALIFEFELLSIEDKSLNPAPPQPPKQFR